MKFHKWIGQNDAHDDLFLRSRLNCLCDVTYIYNIIRPTSPSPSRPGMGPKYCEKISQIAMNVSPSLSICPLACLKYHMSKVHEIFCTCYLWSWLSSLLATMQQYVMYFWRVALVISRRAKSAEQIVINFQRLRQGAIQSPSGYSGCFPDSTYWETGKAWLRCNYDVHYGIIFSSNQV